MSAETYLYLPTQPLALDGGVIEARKSGVRVYG